MIIIGYPGIGKSSVAGIENGIIDLESHLFHKSSNTINGSDDYNWAKRYCDVACDLSNQGFTVCVSSHEEVRNYLEAHPQRYLGHAAIVYPCGAEEMKYSWIYRLEERYYLTRREDATPHWTVEKNYCAWQHAKECYDLDILLMKGSSLFKYEITELPYDLKDVIDICKKEVK